MTEQVERFDLVVIGAGAGGLTAAMYGARLGLKTVVLEGMMPGGQIINAEKIENFPGFPDGLLGADLAPLIERQASAAGAEVRMFTEVEHTYLTIFGLLGGLGVLLGSVGLGLIVMRNVLERRSELALMRAVGFTPGRLRRLVLTEHGLLGALGLLSGVVAAAVAVTPTIIAQGSDVPWQTIEPLTEVQERAVCQIMTELCQYTNCDIETITHWQHQMAYGYHEVKQYLATASFDSTRMYEAFRKRALCNGGGLGLEGPGHVNRMILESRGGWSEAVTYLLLLRGTFMQTMLRYLERYAHNEAEQVIYSFALEAKGRQMSYALEHLQYSLAHDEERRAVMQTLLFIGDRVWAREIKDHVLREALAIVFAGGLNNAATKGMAIHTAMMTDCMQTYVDTCAWLGVPRNLEMMPKRITQYLVKADG